MYIYTIRSKIYDNEIYIGSTKTSVSRRATIHKSCCKRQMHSPLYNHINQNGGWENYYCELYEEFIGTLDQLKKREGELIRQFKIDSSMICLNHNIAGRTPLENLNEKYRNNPDYRLKCKLASKKQYQRLKSSLNTPKQNIMLEDEICNHLYLALFSTLWVTLVAIHYANRSQPRY
jgi:hypothetical protein